MNIVSAGDFTIVWKDREGEPKNPPNPNYPDGMTADLRKDKEQRGCFVDIPYPSGRKNVGLWLLTCKRCKLAVAITAASRPDDVRLAILPCKPLPH